MQTLVAELHSLGKAVGAAYCVAVAGGGTSGLAAITSVPGASHSLLAASAPYCRESFQEFVQSPAAAPDTGFASSSAAVALAAASLRQAKELCRHRTAAVPSILFGFGVASALASVPPRRGLDVVFFAGLDDWRLTQVAVRLRKHARSRWEEEQVAGKALVAGMLAHISVSTDFLPLFRELMLHRGDGTDPIGGAETDAEVFANAGLDCAPEVTITILPEPLERLLSCIPSGPPTLSGIGEVAAPQHATKDDAASAAAAAAALSSSQSFVDPASAHTAASSVLFSPSFPFADCDNDTAAGGGGSDACFAPSAAPPLSGAAPLISSPPSVRLSVNPPLGVGTLIVPGSFNPLHSGHEKLAAAARRRLGPSVNTVVFELSAANVDKPPLGRETVLQRVSQFVPMEQVVRSLAPPPPAQLSAAILRMCLKGAAAAVHPPSGEQATSTPSVSASATAHHPFAAAAEAERHGAQGQHSADQLPALPFPAAARYPSGATGVTGAPHAVVVTASARFLEKAQLFPGAAFAVGYDTAARLINPKYYGGSAEGMERALLELAFRGTRFVVGGRRDDGSGGGFLTLSSLLPSLTPALRGSGLFIGLTEAEFRDDVSSTAIRAAAAAATADSH